MGLHLPTPPAHDHGSARRDFLKASATTTAALTLGALVPDSASRPPPTPPRPRPTRRSMPRRPYVTPPRSRTSARSPRRTRFRSAECA
ncbi:MAG: twin-arginine translocation signal domain-containing protein [Gemmatimonadetes bacterium]|nr:twin-arginine translocation signal domain-containing protein [Gemmatimonadota bacterium]